LHAKVEETDAQSWPGEGPACFYEVLGAIRQRVDFFA
jgi:hypothetical protein